MSTSIVFTDTTGTVTLTNGFDPPGDRFAKWKPMPNPIGPLHHALGTGVPYKWVHRTDYGASFELRYIPNTSQSDCIRLINWLLTGGSITVYTGDTLGSFYTCYLWPGSTPSLSEPDPKDLRRVLALSVLNASEDVMVCEYA